MNTDLAIVLVLLGASIAMFVMNKPRMDAVGLLMLTILPFTGVITMNEALAGFSDPNIVLLGALFVMGEGLVRTGVAQKLGDWLIARAGSSRNKLLILLMSTVGTLGAFMSSTGVVAIFIPVAQRISKATQTPAGQLMMPLSFAALISGMLTLVATAPNLVVNSELVRNDLEGFSFFSFTPFGLPVLVLGILYMLFARRWLGSKASQENPEDAQHTLPGWVEKYKLANREYRLELKPTSPLVGRTVADAGVPANTGFSVIAIERKGRFSPMVLEPGPSTVLESGDVLLIDSATPRTPPEDFCKELGLDLQPLSTGYFSNYSQEIGMVEVMVAADSELIGKSVLSAGFRTRYRLTVIGLRHGGGALESGYLNMPLSVGDTLLLLGPWKEIQRLASVTKDVVVMNLPAEIKEVLPAPGKVPQAVFCLVLMVGLMVSGVVSNVQAALISCLLLGLLRCIDLDSSYRSIHWKSLILIVGMLPFSLALQKTGGVELAADLLMTATGGMGAHGVLGALFLITMLLGLFISNTATAVLMAPVALAMASELQASPYPFAMIVALAASTAFMTPISSPVNTLVVAPGNYRFADFLRIGVPFAFLVLIVSVLLVPLVFPLHP